MIGFLSAVTFLAIVGSIVVYLNEKSHRENRANLCKDKRVHHP